MMTHSKHNQSIKKPVLWSLFLLLLCTVGGGIWMWSSETKTQTTVVSAPPEVKMTRDVLLYFASVDGSALVAETAQIGECPIEEDCIAATVQGLLTGPQSDLVPVLPGQAKLLSVHVEENLVALDFTEELLSSHPGGTQSEMLTVYSLANTLTANFPYLRQVRLLVNGAAIETLKGHIDLRQPIYPDFSFVEEGAAPVGRLESYPAGSEE